MNPQTKRTGIFAIAAWSLLCACNLLEPADPPPPPPPVEYEGCSNNHDQFWAPAETGVQVIDAEGAFANEPCNKLRFHSGDGGQGGNTFHLEPGLHFDGAERDLEELSVTWDMYDFEGNHIGGQGFEVYDYELVGVDEGIRYWSPQFFITAADRGRNVRLVATMVLPTEDGGVEDVVAEGAFYIVGAIAPAENAQ